MKGDDGQPVRPICFPRVEISTVPQREHRYKKLVEQMKAAALT